MGGTLRGSNRRIAAAGAVMLAVWAVGCGADDAAPSTESGSVTSSATSAPPQDRVFVLPETDELSALDSQRASLESQIAGPRIFTFALAGSPDDDADGPRVIVGVADVTGLPPDDVVSGGMEIAVDGRPFRWVSEGDGQRSYAGFTPLGTAIAMSTLNVDEATAVELLATAELTGGAVTFDEILVPDGWVDTGTSDTLVQFLAGATGSSTPIDGTRTLYGDATKAERPSLDDMKDGFGVTLATWPVTGTDPDAEARYNLDGEVDVQIQLADGSSTLGFASGPDSEFLEFVVWQDGSSWLALSRPTADGPNVLAELAGTVREAATAEVEQLNSLQEN